MKGILSILGFTYREQARKKSFIISTIIIYILVIAAICVPLIINTVKDNKSSGSSEKSASTVYIIDENNIISDSLVKLNSSLAGYKFQLEKLSDKASLMEKIKANGNDSLAVLSLQNGSPYFNYYVKSYDSSDGNDVSLAIKKVYAAKLLAQGGVSQDLIGKVTADISYKSVTVGKNSVGGMISSYAIIMILFFAIYMYGYWVAMSIASEKTSRVMEVLITSTKPSRIVIGKSLGMGLLGLSQLLGLIIVGALTYFVAYPKNFQIGGVAISLSGFSPTSIIMVIVYFIFGFSLYAMLNAVCGATVSKAEDIQQAIMPVSLVSIISFYFSYSTTLMPDSSASCAASLIPFTSPFSMPSRIFTSAVPAWQIALSLLILAATTVLAAFISIKLYSSAVLHYGKRLKISELVHMSKTR